MRILGHKRIQNTLVYTHSVNFGDDEYVSKIVTTAEEVSQLIAVGFEYVTDYDNMKVFRKRK